MEINVYEPVSLFFYAELVVTGLYHQVTYILKHIRALLVLNNSREVRIVAKDVHNDYFRAWHYVRHHLFILTQKLETPWGTSGAFNLISYGNDNCF